MTPLIQPYTPDWKNQFESIQKILLEKLEGFILRIEHVGSTSVPDLAAKPIIDLDIYCKRDKFVISKNKQWFTKSFKFVVSSCRCVKFRITFLPRAKYSL